MIITRVTEAAQGSYGRATHPRFWSAPDSWRVRVEELLEVGGKFPPGAVTQAKGPDSMQGWGLREETAAPWQSVEPGSQARQGQSFALESTPPRALHSSFSKCLPLQQAGSRM